DGLLLRAAGDIGGGDDEGAAAVADHAAFEQVEGVGDDAGFEHIVDGDLVDADELEVGHGFDGLGIAHGVLAGGDGDLGELFHGGAVLVHVAVLDHGVVGDEGAAVGHLHVHLPVGGAKAAAAAGADG